MTRASQAREARRNAVETTALRLFAARGYAAVTVEDICHEAGVSPASFYRYFRAKDDVLFAYEADALDALREAIAVHEDDRSIHEIFVDVVHSFAVFWEKQADTVRLREPIMFDQPALLGRAVLVQVGWERELAEALRPAAGADAGTWAAVAVAVLRSAWDRCRDDSAASLPEAVQEGLQALGLSPRMRVPRPRRLG